jgi:hypothetical protein
MDVASWLRSLGLEQYEAVLRENEVDESVLPDLTEDHLRELGFPLGARLKILKAIGALHSNKNSALPTDATTSAPPSAAPEDRAERRQVTVMFSDLVGSTALSARMDPEDPPRTYLGLSEVRCRNRAALSVVSDVEGLGFAYAPSEWMSKRGPHPFPI